MTGPHWKPRTDELRANYTHGPCDTAIIEGRDKDACEGCRQGIGRCVANRPPTWADLPQGCYPTMTGGMTPEEYIAYGRGDQSAALTAVRSGSDQTVELRAKVVLLETELADMRARFEASQALADRAIKERDKYYDHLAVTRGMLNTARRNHDTAENELADARTEIELLQVRLADAESPALHRGTVLSAVPLRTHDGVRTDKAIHPRAVTP